MLIDSAGEADLHDWLADLHRVLAGIYSAGLALPSVTPSDDETEGLGIDHDRWSDVVQQLRSQLGEHDRYTLIWNSSDESEELIQAELSYDLADIYRDVTEGIDMLETGTDPLDAISTWQIGFGLHWGRHAVDALKAVHDLRLSSWL